MRMLPSVKILVLSSIRLLSKLIVMHLFPVCSFINVYSEHHLSRVVSMSNRPVSGSPSKYYCYDAIQWCGLNTCLLQTRTVTVCILQSVAVVMFYT